MELPRDAMMLLSVVNTKLRDEFEDLDDLCEYYGVEKSEIMEKLAEIDYSYDDDLKKFR